MKKLSLSFSSAAQAASHVKAEAAFHYSFHLSVLTRDFQISPCKLYQAHETLLTQPAHEISLPGIFRGLSYKPLGCTQVNSGHGLWWVVVFPSHTGSNTQSDTVCNS